MIQHPDKNYIDPIEIEVRDHHVYCFHVDEEPDGKPLYYDIKRFLQTRDYLENATNGQKYFWMTVESDSIRYVQKCHQWQIHGDFIRVPPNELNVMGSPWPFAAWGMDVIGSIEPSISNEYHFIGVAIDYFTKWVEASTYKAVIKKVVADFVCNNIVC
ncbi:uncharacterized protein [Nicotiana tomentosiformis]|uniref:uncharacterized protein n=1 Tax=Nicotiana tomentosiformis TaxID=4098 RepID=UPI00388C47C8